MIPESYHEFFVAEAGVSAALIGLLFVAISVAPERISGPTASIVEQARASSALTSFLIPLAISLVALLPDSRITIPALVLSAAGLLFVAAPSAGSSRSLVRAATTSGASRASRRSRSCSG